MKANDIVLAFPSSGIHSNGFSLVRKIINKKKITNSLKKDILKPTKIYVNDILKLSEKKLINSAAHITGGGLIENIVRSIPGNLTLNLDLSKIKVLRIFSWLKSQKISDHEMLKTFNCGVGFCVIAKKKNLKKILKLFKKKDQPYIIGNISKGMRRLNLVNKVLW